jgi:Rps23 Pro-64 3,4-dihydroxylase Tpa1-like proline 4-hydroxylase
MNTTQMRNQVKQNIDKLSPEKLIVIAEFLHDLLNDENEDATEELLKISGFESAFKQAKQQVKEGKVKDWRMIRDDV